MPVLNIYSLNSLDPDPNEQHLVASLGVGSHVIGRGALLQVADKRVSRKHAIIEVTDKKIILTSIHINPCFFKAANSRSLIVITQNKNNEINDGDQFALLPENCWYKVKIKTEAPDEAYQSGKRVYEMENNNTCDAKKARLCTDVIQTAVETAINGSTKEICTTTPKIEHEENMECQQLTGIDISEETNSSTLPNIEYTEDMHHQTNPNSPKSEIEGHSNETSIEGKEHEFGVHQETTQVIQNVDNETKVSVVEDQTGNPNVEKHEDVVTLEIKEELLELHEANEAESAKAESSVPQTVEIKLETVDERDNKDLTNHSTVEDEENGEAHILPVELGPSTSGTANVQTRGPRREKCWYGDTCYRKNSNHKAAFSHPGDDDYRSGEQDDQCPYGSTCYRHNLEHRRMYKHDTKPAKKPTLPTAQGAKKSPLIKNDDSEDDYDYSDPFLNDDSGDDFDPSDYGIESSESDFEDSQEVDETQDRRRMMREAKKIIKRKK